MATNPFVGIYVPFSRGRAVQELSNVSRTTVTYNGNMRTVTPRVMETQQTSRWLDYLQNGR